MKPDTPTAATGRLGPIEEEILRAIRRVRYGSVEITIHDSRVVQIEQKEKLRFADRPDRTAGGAGAGHRQTVHEHHEVRPVDRRISRPEGST